MNISSHELATRRCRAHKTNGDPCPNWAIRGGVVCHVHGGRSPQVKRAAKERLNDLVDPALVRLEALLQDRNAAVALGAVKDVLDRAGFKPVERNESLVIGAFTLRIDRGSNDDDG